MEKCFGNLKCHVVHGISKFDVSTTSKVYALNHLSCYVISRYVNDMNCKYKNKCSTIF